MRIALLTTSYPVRAGDAAGQFVQCEAMQLARAGHEVHVLAPGEARIDGDGERGAEQHVDDASGEHHRDDGDGARQVATNTAGPRLWRLGGGELFGWPGAIPRARESPLRAFRLIGFAARARLRLRRIAPERLIAHFIVPCGYPLSLATPGSLEVVLHGSDARIVCALPRPLLRHLVRALLTRGAAFRFPSEQLRREFTRALPPAEAEAIGRRSRVVLPEMALPAVIPQRPQRQGPGEAWVACGRLIASKRVDRVIREAAKRGASLTVVGDGPERAALEELARQLLPTTRFTGQLLRADALAEIAACDRLVHLSELEGAPSVIREARALGVRVLASAAGDVAEWAARDPGIELFEPR